MRKRIIKILVSVLVIGLAYSGFILYKIQTSKNVEPNPNADTMLILGAKVWGDEINPVPSPVLKERLDTAISYLKNNPNTIVIVCGGQGSDEPASEAYIMAKYLSENGIDSARIISEDKSTSSIENIRNAMALRDLGKTVIVTSDYHVARAIMHAKRLGISEVTGLGAESKTSSKLENNLREILALGYHFLFSR